LHSKLFETDELAALGGSLQRLPWHVLPLPDEALVSWCGRLAERLGWSVAALARDGFGIQGRLKSDWWVRPSVSHLHQMAARSGVAVETLRRMSFLNWAGPVRDDEASERFAGWRYESQSPAERGRGLAVCTQCLAGDAVPYLRLTWLVGWSTVCESHGTVLHTKCRRCWQSLRVASPASKAAFTADHCVRCAADLKGFPSVAASLPVKALQDALLVGKRTGATALPGIGPLTWSEVITLVDVLVGAIWEQMSLDDLFPFLERVAQTLGMDGRSGFAFLKDRLGSLALAAWLLEDWPRNLLSTPIRDLAMRWIGGEPKRIPTQIGPAREEVCGTRLHNLLSNLKA